MNDNEHATGDSPSEPVPEGDQAAMESGHSSGNSRDGCDRAREIVTEIVREVGGRKGPDPVRYGDWEKNGRCIDF
ncbi:MAG: DUF1674 domain-containing protein [Wenzhouxiangellaceae bacterium]